MRSSCGRLRRSAASSFIRSASAWPAVSARHQHVRARRARTRGRRGRGSCSSSRRRSFVWLSGMPIMSQMISSGSGAAISVTKSQLPLSITRSIVCVARRCTSSSRRAERARREAARDDAAQPPVARVVHVDHGAEELVERSRAGRGCWCPCRSRTRRRRGSPSSMSRVPRERPVARAARQRDLRRRLELLVERDRLLAAQRGEGGLAPCRRLGPELDVREIDVLGADLVGHFRFSSSTSAARRVST